MLLEILILISFDLCHFLKTHTEFSSSFTPLEATLKARRPVRQRGIMQHTTEVNNTSRTESWISAHLHHTVNSGIFSYQFNYTDWGVWLFSAIGYVAGTNQTQKATYLKEIIIPVELCCNYKLVNLLFTPEMLKKNEHKERGSVYQKNRKTQYGTKVNFNLVFPLYRKKLR